MQGHGANADGTRVATHASHRHEVNPDGNCDGAAAERLQRRASAAEGPSLNVRALATRLPLNTGEASGAGGGVCISACYGGSSSSSPWILTSAARRLAMNSAAAGAALSGTAPAVTTGTKDGFAAAAVDPASPGDSTAMSGRGSACETHTGGEVTSHPLGAAAAAAATSTGESGVRVVADVDVEGAGHQPVEPRTRVLFFCIPQAGMGAWVYHAWEQRLAPHGVEVLAIELPGHNSRMREPLAKNLLHLAADIADVVRRFVNNRGGLPYALFGHSMGAWIAYEVVQDLMRSGSPLPVHLFISGCRAPHLFSDHDDLDPTRLHKLATAEEFWNAFEARYGTSNPHLANRKIRQLVWPVLRADFTLIETYELPAANLPVPVPTTVFAGELDRRYTHEQVHSWSRHLAGPSTFIWLTGTCHDYVERAHPLLLKALEDILKPL